MRREILSTARPSALRLAGFLCLAAGAVIVGATSTMRWVVLGFPGDTQGTADVPVHGTDVWEGKVVLFSAVLALVALLAIRLAGPGPARRVIALLLVALGIVCAVLPALDAVRAAERFGGGEGLDRIAHSLAGQAGLPEDVVRRQLAAEFRRQLRVDVGPAPWATAAGGVLLVAGGALSVAWSRRRPDDSQGAVSLPESSGP